MSCPAIIKDSVKTDRKRLLQGNDYVSFFTAIGGKVSRHWRENFLRVVGNLSIFRRCNTSFFYKVQGMY